MPISRSDLPHHPVAATYDEQADAGAKIDFMPLAVPRGSQDQQR